MIKQIFLTMAVLFATTTEAQENDKPVVSACTGIFSISQLPVDSISKDPTFNRQYTLRRYFPSPTAHPEQPSYSVWEPELEDRMVLITWTQPLPAKNYVRLELIGRLWSRVFERPMEDGREVDNVLKGRAFILEANLAQAPRGIVTKIRNRFDFLLGPSFFLQPIEGGEKIRILDYSQPNLPLSGEVTVTPLVPFEARNAVVNMALDKPVRVTTYAILPSDIYDTKKRLTARLQVLSIVEGTLIRDIEGGIDRRTNPLVLILRDADGKAIEVSDSPDHFLSIEPIDF